MKSIIVLLIIMSISIPVALAQTESLITITTDEKAYSEGDTIVISGKVNAIIQGTPIILQVIFGEGNIIEVAQIDPAEDGRYTHTILAQGPLWQNDGEYIARTAYGTGNIAESDFEFVTKQDSPKIEKIFEIDGGSSGTFDVEYAIIGGTVENMIIDEEQFALITIIDSIDDGTITLEIPRDWIDAKTNGCEGSDDVYIILIDGIEVPYQEIGTTANTRVITIEFEQGDNDIEIIGTCVVPEFGSIALAILAISIISIITLSRKSTLRI